MVSFVRFVPGKGSGRFSMLTAMVNLPDNRLSVLNEMHTNSYKGPRLSEKLFLFRMKINTYVEIQAANSCVIEQPVRDAVMQNFFMKK